MTKTREPFARSFEQRLYPVSVHDVGCVDLRLEQKALRIDQNVAFSTLDLLACVVASLPTAHAGALHRLGIDDSRAGLRISPEADPQTLADGRVDPFPGAVDAPETEVMVDGLPRWEVVGQEPPGAAATENVEDSVEDLAQRVEPGASGSLRNWQVGLDESPFGVGEVGSVCSFHHARYPTEQSLQDPFSDSFSYQ